LRINAFHGYDMTYMWKATLGYMVQENDGHRLYTYRNIQFYVGKGFGL